MEKTQAYKAFDGTLFDTAEKALEHESKTFAPNTVFKINKCHMVLPSQVAILVGESLGGFVAFVDESDELVNWYSLHWTKSEIMQFQAGEFTVEPWGAYEQRMKNYWLRQAR